MIYTCKYHSTLTSLGPTNHLKNTVVKTAKNSLVNLEFGISALICHVHHFKFNIYTIFVNDERYKVDWQCPGSSSFFCIDFFTQTVSAADYHIFQLAKIYMTHWQQAQEKCWVKNCKKTKTILLEMFSSPKVSLKQFLALFMSSNWFSQSANFHEPGWCIGGRLF